MSKLSPRIALVGALALLSPAVSAEMTEINVAQQYGISYLPLMLMEEHKLIEKHAKAAGVDVKVGWAKFAGRQRDERRVAVEQPAVRVRRRGAVVTLWARTKGNLDVKAVAAINSMPLYLNTRNPNVKTIKDFTEKDENRAAGRQGVDPGRHAADGRRKGVRRGPAGETRRADRDDVLPGRADGAAFRASEITAHFSSPPFQYQQLATPGHPHGAELLRRARRAGNVQRGVDDVEVPQRKSEALRRLRQGAGRSHGPINRDKKAAAEAYLRISKDKDTVNNILAMLNDPAIVYTTTPQNVMKYVDFMAKTGSIKVKPDSWKDLFFPNIHGAAGS